MAISLATKFAPYTDELFKAESKTSLLTNSDFDWTGAKTVCVWKISTADMNDYGRTGAASGNFSRFGALLDLDAQTEDMILTKDRSFIFNIDKLDQDETANQVEAASALARQIREEVIPEVDSYVYSVMATNAGTKATAAALTKANVYEKILAGSQTLDDAEVPDTDRVLVVTPATYALLKQAAQFDNTDITAEQRMTGVIGMLDGMAVVRVPASRLPANTGFMIAHPSATVAPIKLEDYNIHENTPLSSGSIVTGRVCYDCFVLDNKADGIYYYPVA